MIQRHFDAITIADVGALVENEVSESKTIEYKRDLPGGADKDKKGSS